MIYSQKCVSVCVSTRAKIQVKFNREFIFLCVRLSNIAHLLIVRLLHSFHMRSALNRKTKIKLN